MSVNEKMTAIADAIRDKTGGTDALTLDGMAESIPEVYEAGKKAEYDAFWDEYQQNGNATDYSQMFSGYGWDDISFKPKYDINVRGSCGYAFYRNRITDLKQVLLNSGVVMDLSKATDLLLCFAASTKLTTLPRIDISGATGAQQMFASCTALASIDELVVRENLSFNKSFSNCITLNHMIVTGTIGQNGLDIHWSTKLDKESLLSIINCLKDYSADTSGTTWAVTLGPENLAKLTDAEKAVATQKGWTLV